MSCVVGGNVASECACPVEQAKACGCETTWIHYTYRGELKSAPVNVSCSNPDCDHKQAFRRYLDSVKRMAHLALPASATGTVQ